MKNTTELKEFAQLAQAAYAILNTEAIYKNSKTTKDALLASPNGGFADGQATDFTERYHVINQFRDVRTIANGGFSATLFEDRANPNRAVLSFAGTEFTTDFLRDGLLTDSQIGTVGYARPQAAAAYRYIRQLKTSADVSVSYTEQELLNLFQLAGYTDSNDYPAFKLDVLKDKGISGGAGGTPLLKPGMEIDVAGHSLGGHLALLVQRLFPGDFDDVITVNAATFYGLPLGLANPLKPQTEGLLSLFGQWDNSKILRIESVGDGVSELGALHPGKTLTVGMETQPGALAAFGPNHSVANVADGLALTELMGKIDARYMDDPRVVKTVFDAASKIPGVSYETLLDDFRKIIQGNASPSTTPDETDATKLSATRKSLYDNIKALSDSATFKALVGKATIQLADSSLETTAKTDFAAFLSLNVLSTAIVSTSDATALAALKTANTTLTQDWDADKSARLQGDTGKVFAFSDSWYADRAAMLGWLVKRNLDDDTNLTIKAPQDLRFLDEARKIDLRLGASTTGDDNRKKFHFGDAQANQLTGASKEDHLYGGSGADTLDGKDGADYLEGGADADTYLLQTGLAGIDTLADSGSNTIKVDGQTVTGAFAQVAGMGGDIYYSADKAYQLRKAEDGVWRLSAKNTGTGQYNAVADLKNWKDGDYNLTIGAPTQEPDRVAPVVYPNSNAYLAMDGAAAPKGVTFGGGTKSDSFNGSAFDDVITTGGGLGNYVMAFAGDDLVVGGEGRDFIRTGSNSASPTMQDNDIAFGGEESDVLMGGGGDDQLWGEYVDSANEAAGADSGERGDWVSGELGNDTLNGSRRSDVLFGGAGQDIVKGGAGDDLILGDAHYTPFSKSTALPYAESTTQSFIWDDARQDMVKVHPSNYSLHPVTIASGLAYNWTVERTAGDDFALKAPAGLITQQRVAANGGDDRLFGGEGADWMAGQTGGDALFGGDGDDTMYGDDIGMAEADAGQDLMYGDAGNDRMWGGAKNDVMDGGAGNDKLYGEAGDDFLLGGGGDDELSGNEGADTLDGGTGADRLLGGDGDDQLWGADGDDTLDGGAGADRLHGGRGKDQLQGGVGDDTYLFDAGDDAGVVSTATDSEGNNTVELSGGALKDMQLTGSDSAWLLRYTKDDSVQLSGSFKVQWGGRSYTLAELAKAIADATPPDTPPPPANSAPSVAKPLQNTSAVEFVPLVLPIADGTFIDPDKNDKLTYSASLVGGAALPTWLVFDAPTRTLRGTPDGNAAGALQLRITATDAAGLSASSDFELSISDAPTPPAPHTIVGTPGDDTLKGSAGADTMRGDAGNDTLKGLEGDDELHGEDGEDTLRAGDGADKLYGGTGDDTLYGDAGDDVLDGGAGNDTLQGGLGSDTYLFGRGDGQDTLKGQKDTTPGKLDTLRFKDGIAASDVQASRDGSALLLTIAGTGDSMRVESFFTSNNPGNDSNPLQQVQFADGTVWDLDAITKRAATGSDASEVLKGTNGADTMYAGAGNDTLQGLDGDDELHGEDGEDTLRAGNGADKLYGGAGDDALYGDAGDDILDGGVGNDIVQGGLGNDTYLFGRGDGQDNLKGQSDTAPGKLNTLRFKDSVAAADVQAGRDGSALLLSIAGTTDSVRVESFFTNDDPGNASNPLQQVQFADGTVWDLNTLVQRALTGNDTSETIKGTVQADTIHAGAGNDTLQGLGGDDLLYGEDGEDTLRAGDGADQLFGGAGDDALYGDAGDDTLYGGAGNDIVQGGLGNDTYLFGRGDGADRITENDTTLGNTDVLSFTAGIDADQLWFRRVGTNLEVSIIGSTDTCTISQWYASDARHIEQFKIADGKTLLDSQVNNLVQAMAAFAPPAAGQSTLAAHYQTALNPVIAANWQ